MLYHSKLMCVFKRIFRLTIRVDSHYENISKLLGLSQGIGVPIMNHIKAEREGKGEREREREVKRMPTGSKQRPSRLNHSPQQIQSNKILILAQESSRDSRHTADPRHPRRHICWLTPGIIYSSEFMSGFMTTGTVRWIRVKQANIYTACSYM